MPHNGVDERIDALLARLDALLDKFEEVPRLADAVMTLAHAAEKQQVTAEAINYALHRLPDVVDSKTAQYMIPCREMLAESRSVYERALVVARDETRSKLERIEANVIEHRREETGRHAHEKDTPDGVKGVIKTTGETFGKFGKLPFRTQVLLWILAMFLVAALFTQLGAWWHEKFGGDSTTVKMETHERRELPHR